MIGSWRNGQRIRDVASEQGVERVLARWKGLFDGGAAQEGTGEGVRREEPEDSCGWGVLHGQKSGGRDKRRPCSGRESMLGWVG